MIMMNKHKKRTMEHSAGIECEKKEAVHTTNSLRFVWYKLRERVEDLYDLLRIWWYRNEPATPMREVFEKEDKRRGIEHV
ncbi:hypothetical protein Barb7_02988 [Bacteroidales bacterium Barb7]|nr:hypothetical protein Barb7_02988 [Bacteroidales bacterium Barb7]